MPAEHGAAATPPRPPTNPSETRVGLVPTPMIPGEGEWGTHDGRGHARTAKAGRRLRARSPRGASQSQGRGDLDPTLH
jgi:hypothetical protein